MNWEVIVYSSVTVGIIFAVIAVLYYLTTAKNIKKQHGRYQDILAEIKVGDEVIFAGGLVGTIQSIDPERVFVTLKLGQNNTVKAAIYSISSIVDK